MTPSLLIGMSRRKRAVGIRPRTFNFYCKLPVSFSALSRKKKLLADWLPNHMLVLHVLLLFAILNPVVLPFGVLYFFVEAGMPAFHDCCNCSEFR